MLLGGHVVAPTVSAVGNLAFTVRTSISVTLAWTADASATSFVVQYRTAGGSTWTTSGTPTASPYTVSGLSYQANWDFQVIAQGPGGSAAPTQLLNVMSRPMIGSHESNGPGSNAAKAQFSAYFGRRPEMLVDALNQKSQMSGLPASAQYVVQLGIGVMQASGANNGFFNVIGVPMAASNNGANTSTLADAAAGVYDSYFTTVANYFVSSGVDGTTVIRLGWEFNSSSQEWNAASPPQVNAVDFVNAFQHIVTLFRGISSKFRFEWCWLMDTGSGTVNPSTVYPGDAYVDSIACDAYNLASTSATPATRWAAMLSVANVGLNALAAFASAHNKPIGIPEFGAGTPFSLWGGDDTTYTTNMCAWIQANPVWYASWFDSGAFVISGPSPTVPNSAAIFASALGGALIAPDIPAVPGTPATPTNGTPTTTAITLNGVSPSGGGTAELFGAQYRVHGTTPWFTAQVYSAGVASGTAVAIAITGLTTGTQYDLQFLAANRGSISLSPIITATTL